MKESLSQNATSARRDVAKKPKTVGAKSTRRKTFFNVREALSSYEAKREYDKYVTEHRERLTQLYREARGEMTPSVESYGE